MSSDDKNDDILRKPSKVKKNTKLRDEGIYSTEDNLVSPEIDDTDESVQFFSDLGINDVQGDLSNDKKYDEIYTLLTKKQKDTINKKLTTIGKTKSVRADIRQYFGPPIQGSNLSIPAPDYLSSDDEDNKNEKKSSSEHLDKKTITKLPDDVTYIYGLSTKVLYDLQVIARVEIEELFERYSIKWIRYRQKKGKDSGVFNVSLVNLLKHDQKKDPTLRIPLFFLRLIEKLDTNCDEEGILRISGSVSRIREMRNELDSSKGHIDSILKDATAADLSGLLKQFIKDLPSSLLTNQFIDAYPSALKISDQNDRIYAFQLLNLLLPDVHKACFQILMRLLHRVINNPNNKMTLENVATLMGPNLFVSSKSKASDLEVFSVAVQAIHTLLKIDEYLWIVPPKLIQQIRRNYNKKLKLQTRIASQLGESSAQNFQLLTINIDTQPQHQISLSIDMTTKVSSIVDRILGESFMKNENKANSKNLRLFEHGGNIYYRLLSRTANIHSIIIANPTAQFFASISSTHRLVTRIPKNFEPHKF